MGDAGTISFKTNAKINLFLRVVGRRQDGFHELESIFHSVSLADDMRVSSSDTRGIDVAMRAAASALDGWPKKEGNLAYLAARALQERNLLDRGVRIEIGKRIPMAGGMAGGSANAAGTLVAINDLYGLGLSQDELFDVAASVGSDVPYCVVGGTALVMGRGETVTPLPAPAAMWFVLAMSDEPMITGEVYDAFDDVDDDGDEARSAPMALALGAGDVGEVASLLHNDLEAGAYALRPGLRHDKEALLEAGCLGVGMTGSGPTLFGIVEGPEHGRRVTELIRHRFARVEVALTAPACVEFG